MEIELGLKITHNRDDATSSTEFRFAKDHSGPLFFSRETAIMYILIAYLRGFKRENIKIKISEDGKQLTIGGKMPVQEITLRGWIMHKKDVEIREFKKVFFIPAGVNLNRTKAKFNNEESTLRITMPKLVKGICGIEIQEVTAELRERYETAIPVDDQAHEKDPEVQLPEEIDQVEQRECRCEPALSDVVADQSFLKDRESLEEGAEGRKETINDIVEKAADTLKFEKDNRVEPGEIGGGEFMTPATVDKSPQKDGTSMEEVEAPMMRKLERIDDVADQALDTFQGNKQNQLEKDEIQEGEQDQVEKAFVKVQSDKQDHNQRDISRRQPEAPPVVIDETSCRSGKPLKEDVESLEGNKMDQMVKQKHDEADQAQKRDVHRCELEISQATRDKTAQKYAKSLEEDAESMMPRKLDQLVDKPPNDEADKVQPSEVCRYEPEMPQVTTDETLEKDISEAKPDKMEKFQFWEHEIPESMLDETKKHDAMSLEGGSESMMESKEEIDQVEEHLDGEQQSDKGDHEEKMEVNRSEPKEPQVMLEMTSQIENSQEDATEKMKESEEKKGEQVAEQVVDEQQYDKSSRKNGSSMEQVETPKIIKKEKGDHVLNQAFAEIQGNKQNQQQQDQFLISQQDQMNQRDVSKAEPEAPVVVDDASQKGGKLLEEDVSRGEHDEADHVQQREVSRRELEIPHAVIDETAQKDVKSQEEGAESIMPSKVDQLVGKPQHDEADQVEPGEVSKYEPEITQSMIDEATEKHISKAQHEKIDQVKHRKVGRHELEMPEAIIYETLQKDGKPLEEGVEPIIKRKETIDQIKERAVGGQQSDKVVHAEQSEVSRYEPEVPEPIVDVPSEKEEKSHEDCAELMRESKEKIPNQVVEPLVDERKYDKADQAEKREASRSGPEMPAIMIDATSPEDGKSQQEAAEVMVKSKEKISQEVEQVFDEPKRDKMDQVKQRTISRSKPRMPQEIIDDTSENNGKFLEGANSVIKFPEQLVDEPQSATDKANRVDQRDVSRFKPEISDAVQSSQKDGKSLEEDAEIMMKNKEKTDQVLEKVVEHGKAEDVGEVCSETETRKWIPEKRLKEPENKEGKKLEEKLNEAESKDIQAVATVMPQTIASTRFEEATPEKKERPASFLQSTSREHLEAHHAAQEEVYNVQPAVAKDTVEEASKNYGEFLKETTKQKRDKEEGIESLMDHESDKWRLNEVDEVNEVPQELDGNKLTPEEQSKKVKTEEKERETEMTMEEKLTEDPEKMESAIEMMPQTTASSQLGEGTPEEVEGTITSLKMPAPQFKPFKADHEVQKTVDNVAPRKHEETFKGSKRAKIERQEVRVKNELQLGEVERMADASSEMHDTKSVSEQIYETPKTKVKEETEKAAEEKHDQLNKIEDFPGMKYPETIVESHKKNVIEWKPEVARTATDDEPKEDNKLVEEATKSKICSEEGISQDMHNVTIEHQLNERERVAKFSPQIDAKELIREGEVEKKKARSMKKTEKAAEEKLDGGESMEENQTTKSMHLREATPKKKEPERTYSIGVKDVTKCEIDETARVAYGEATKSNEQSVKETVVPKVDGDEGADQAIQDVIHEWQAREVEEVAQDSSKKDSIETPDKKYEISENVCMDKPEELVGEKPHEREFREMEGTAHVMPQSSRSMGLEEYSSDGNKHPVSSVSYPATQVETSKPHHFEKKDISKWEPEVGKVLVDEQLERDKEAEIIETKRKGEDDIDQDELQGQLIKTESAGKTSAEMDGRGTIRAEELEMLKPAKKEETEKAVEMKINEGPKKTDMVLQTIESRQPEEDTAKRTELPSASTLHPKMISESDASERHYDGVKEATKRELEVAKGVVEKAPKKEEDRFQELAKPKMKTEVESYQAMHHLVEEVKMKEQEAFQEITKPKIKVVEESDQATQHVAGDLRVSDIDGAAAVSSDVDHRTFLLEQSFGKPKLEIKDERKKMEEKVDEGDFKAMEEATGMVPEIVTGLKPEESDPAMKEYTVIPPSYLETPRLGNETLDTRQERQTEISKWKPESVQSAVDKMQQKDKLPSEQSADSQSKSENVSDHVAEAVVEDSCKMDVRHPTPEKTSQIPKIEAAEEFEPTVVENVDEGEYKTAEDEGLVEEAEPGASLTMQSEEANTKGEENSASLASYPGSRTKESEGSKIIYFGEKKANGQEYDELAKFPTPYALAKDKESAEEISKLEIKSKEKIDQVKEMDPEMDVSKLVPLIIDGDPKMTMKEETKKLVDENVDEEKLKTKKDAARGVPQTIETVKGEETTHEKYECSATPALRPTPATTKFTGSESDHAKEKEVSERETENEGVKSAVKDQKENDHIMEHMSGEHGKDEDSGLEYENELDKNEPGLSTEGAIKTFYQKKQHVDTPIPDNQSQGDGDHALDEKHEQRSVTTLEKQEVGMNFEGPVESAEPDRKGQEIYTPLLDDGDLRKEGDHEQGNEIESEKNLSEKQNEMPILADEPEQNGAIGRDESHGLHGETESEKMEPHVIPEGPMNPETDSEKEQVGTPVLADKKDDGRRTAKVRELGKEIEEIHDHLQLPEKKEIEELESPEMEMQKNFRIEQTGRIKCKLRSFLFFVGSTFLLPAIVIVMKKNLIEFKSKKR